MVVCPCLRYTNIYVCRYKNRYEVSSKAKVLHFEGLVLNSSISIFVTHFTVLQVIRLQFPVSC